MGFFRGVKRFIKPLVDVPRWMDLKRVTKGAGLIAGIAKRLVVPVKPTREETFEEALARLNLTEEILAQRKMQFLRLAVIFLVFGIIIFFYSIYLFFVSSWIAGLIALVIACYAFAQTFRFHFWYFQTKERRLGCTFREWLLVTFFREQL